MKKKIGVSLHSMLCVMTLTFIREDLDAMRAVVRNEDFVLVVGANAVRKFEVARAREFLEHIAVGVEDDDAHHFAFNHDDVTLFVDADAAWMLKDVGAEFAQELAVLIVDLDLMSWRTLGDDEIASCPVHSHTAIGRS